MTVPADARSRRAGWLRGGLIAAAVVWCALLLVTPAPRSASAPRRVAEVLTRAIGARICHQRPDRTWHLHGRPMAVCGRCAGLYVAGALGLVVGGATLRRPVRPRGRELRWLVAAAVPTAATWALEAIGVWNPGTVVRGAAALPLGATAGWLLTRVLR